MQAIRGSRRGARHEDGPRPARARGEELGAGASRPPAGHAVRHPVLRDGLGAGVRVLHAARALPDAREHDVRRGAPERARGFRRLHGRLREPLAESRPRAGAARRRDVHVRRGRVRGLDQLREPRSDVRRRTLRLRRRRLVRDGPRERRLERGHVRRGLAPLAAPVLADDGRVPRALGREAGQPLPHRGPRLRDLEPEDLGLRRRGAHPAGVLRRRAGDPRDEPRVQPACRRTSATTSTNTSRRRSGRSPSGRTRASPSSPTPSARAGGTGSTPTPRGRTCRSTASRGSSAAASRRTRGSSARSASRSARTRTRTSPRTRRTTRTGSATTRTTGRRARSAAF